MKKLVPFLLIIWILIGIGSFFVWWKVTRNLTAEDVTNHANKIAAELEIPWILRFKHIRPSYGADFKVQIEGVEAISQDGTKLLIAKTAEVRLPWSIFFSKNPLRINIAIDDVKVTSWVRILNEIEAFLDKRKSDRTQQMSLPQQVIESSYNFRLTNLTGPWNEKDFTLSKLYLLNIDPKSPTAFEVVYPWEFEINGAKIAGETKALGEYRVALQKADLHYYLKTRMQTTRDNRVRSAEFSVEGKGFYHPRMGLFSTLSGKDEWIAFVGDIEWTPNNLKLNFPKYAVSHDLAVELLPFSGLHGGNSPYQSSSLSGELLWFKSPVSKQLMLKVRTKTGTKINFDNKGEVPFSLQILSTNNETVTASIDLDSVSRFELRNSRKDSFLKWSPELFLNKPSLSTWLEPHDAVWRLVYPLPWSRLSVSIGDRTPYYIEKFDKKIKVSQFSPQPEMPYMNLVYPMTEGENFEWSAQFESRPLDEMFKKMKLDFPFVPGHAYTGQIHFSENKELGTKLAWQGGVLPLIAKSSCKSLIQDKPELRDLINGNFINQAELKITANNFKIIKWIMKDPSANWEISGEWSNSPIRCDLKILHKPKNKKIVTHTVVLN